MNDRELADSIITRGDTKSFALIVSRYSGMVYSRALTITRREELAAEVTQQTFVKAFDNLGLWCGQSLGPWLTAIASHTALNILDKEKRRRGKPIELMTEAETPQIDNGSEEHERRLALMERAICSLPEADRSLIEMYYDRHLPTDEIARKTGLTRTNVAVRLHRIRERLKKMIKNETD